MYYNHGGEASEDAYNGNIEFENETQWRESTDARVQEEEREFEIAMALSLASEDAYNGNIEFENETRWRESTDARVQEEEREFEIAMALSLGGRLSLNGPRGGDDRDYSIHLPPGDGSHVGGDFPKQKAPVQPIEKYTCAKCDLDCSSQAELGDHMDIHQHAFDLGWGVRTDKRDIARKYLCSKCDNVFDSAYDASRHRAMHNHTWDYGWKAHRERNQGKIVTCKKCYRSFLTARELEDHVLRIHPMFDCGRCERRFCTTHELEDHIFNVH